MKCNDCDYIGVVFEHLKGFEGIEEWRNCEYPLPYNVVQIAVPMGVEHECKVFKALKEE